MNRALTVSETVELLDNLRSAVRDAAIAEENLNREFQTKTEAAEKAQRAEIEASQAQLAEALKGAQKNYELEQQHLLARVEGRASRVKRAYQNAQRRATERIDNEEGRRKYSVQKGTLDAERAHDEGLKENERRWGQFQNQIAANHQGFAALEEATQRAFRGYGKFRRLLAKAKTLPPESLALDEHALLTQLQQMEAKAAQDLAQFSRFFLPRLFGFFRLWLWVVVIAVLAAGSVPAAEYYGVRLGYNQVIPLGAAVLALVFVLFFWSQRAASSLAGTIADAVTNARPVQETAMAKAHAHYLHEIDRIKTETRNKNDALQHEWQNAIEKAAVERRIWPPRLERKWLRASETHERLYRARVQKMEEDHTAAINLLKLEAETRRSELERRHSGAAQKLRGDYDTSFVQFQTETAGRINALSRAIEAAKAQATVQFPPWPKQLEQWAPPSTFANAAKFAELEVDVAKIAETVPRDKRLAFPATLSVPLLLVYPDQGSILFETTKSANRAVIGALNNIIYRLLATSPPGKLSFTVIDPVKLGENFAGVMHLTDYEENIMNGRIWTEPGQIEERLSDLNQHMEKVIQMYLRNEYATITEYNRQAGNIAEKYHFLVVADFPANFTDAAVRRLLRIAASGARCGVYTLIHWDHRHTAPPDFLPDELRAASVCINVNADQLTIVHPAAPKGKLLLDAPPDPELATAFLQRVGEVSRGSNRVEVPFDQVAPAEPDLWSLDTADEIRVPIGRSGATKLQYLALGKGTRQHALIAGKTGSGKSTLFHVMITNLALWCSPEQVEFYLIDFKKGVEFKCYASQRLPHARVVAIESDREFGLSVLERVDQELRRRGDLYRKAGAQDLAGFRKASPGQPMPRSLLMIDEFQEFFTEEDRISQAAAVLLDRIVRQGRAFGIHVLLGSQTLGGAYTLARATMGQMVVRIALQCNEADAYLIMDESNPAPRLLSRPGEGIYNDMAGVVEGNSPFQAVWLSEDERDAKLQTIRHLAERKHEIISVPIVFEGNAPADIRENPLLAALLERPPVQPPNVGRVWLGAPNSIKTPTEAAFQKRSGNNLLIVGQRNEPVLAMFAASFIALAAQYPRESSRFILIENAATGSPEREFLERVSAAIPHKIHLVKAGEIPDVIDDLDRDLKSRAEQPEGGGMVTFLFIHELQNFKKLRLAEDYGFSLDPSEKGLNTAAQFQTLITEGPSSGLHVIASIDSYNNVNRFLGRKLLTEFEMRVLFQMSANDSASLCDDPKASVLGLHRALFYNEQEGHLETFRPYALPDSEWIEAAGRKLAHSPLVS